MFWKAGRVLYKKDIEGEGKFGLLKGAPGKVKVIHKSDILLNWAEKFMYFTNALGAPLRSPNLP